MTHAKCVDKVPFLSLKDKTESANGMKNKKRNIALIVVSSVLFCILVCVCTLVGVAQLALDKTDTCEFLGEWMRYIDDDALLTNIVIPGSHDAGTKGMMWMAETQDKSVADQLDAGTRYLDLRVKLKKGELVINHTVINGQKLSIVLKQINTFLFHHPTETVLIDFQKFAGDDECPSKVMEMALDILGSKIICNEKNMSDLDFVSSLTLKEARGKCLLFWGKEDVYLDPSLQKFVFVRDKDCEPRFNSVLHSYYTRANNTRVSKAYIKKSMPEYIEMFKRENSGFFVLQAQLTDPIFIVGPRVMESTHDKNVSEYIKAMKDSADLQYINIIMRDFVGARKNSEIIALNLAKGLVIDEGVFSAGLNIA